MYKFLIVLIFSILSINLIESVDRKTDCGCSVSRNQTTNLGSYSWIANLYEDGIFKCSGSIVNEYLVIFSRKCTENQNGNYSVTVGEIKQNEKLEKISKSNLYKVQYVSTSTAADSTGIAMMRLYSPIKFTNTIKPSCLDPNEKKQNYITPINLIGFGNEGELNEISYEDISRKIYCTDNLICTRKMNQNDKSEIEFKSSGLAQYTLGTHYTSVIGIIDGPDNFYKNQINMVRIGRYFKWISNYARGDLC